ncbi:hypothetical protein VNO78_26658 [Psophocarpus tetragonolobus]|uniref:BHLH domain-containing protein n=1 Tax=Psophocarpus tetragonolobus TaxID=3891 RepID=A0AAN9RZL6_PSOTE
MMAIFVCLNVTLQRRSRINEKLKALQNLIPNSNKTDKASMLDEAIEYLKQLQLQVQSVQYSYKLEALLEPTFICNFGEDTINSILIEELKN